MNKTSQTGPQIDGFVCVLVRYTCVPVSRGIQPSSKMHSSLTFYTELHLASSGHTVGEKDNFKECLDNADSNTIHEWKSREGEAVGCGVLAWLEGIMDKMSGGVQGATGPEGGW